MPRRVRFIVFFGVVAMLVLATGISAGAAPGDNIESAEAEVADAQDRLAEIRLESSVQKSRALHVSVSSRRSGQHGEHADRTYYMQPKTALRPRPAGRESKG
jgi:hypothetical protein